MSNLIGNSNAKIENPKKRVCMVRLNQGEYELIAAAADANGKKISTWLREMALAAACIGNKKVSFKMTQLPVSKKKVEYVECDATLDKSIDYHDGFRRSVARERLRGQS